MVNENCNCKKECTIQIPHFWVNKLPKDLCANAIYFVKTQTGVQMWVTSINKVPTLIGDSDQGVVGITSPDASLTISQVEQDFQISLSQTLKDLIQGALQPNDNISELTNDAGFITLADIPEQGLQTIQEGDNIQVDSTDPLNPIVSVIGLGSAAFTDTTDYATVQQGQLADTALQPNDNISELQNDAGYITQADVPPFDPTDYDLNDFNNASPDPYARLSEVGGATNLSYTPSPTQGTVNSDTGTDAIIPATDSTNAGLFLPAEKTKLANIEAGADLTDISIQNAQGAEQFRVTDNVKFEGVSFSALDKKLAIDPLVPLSAFLDVVNGNDATATIENSRKPYKTLSALINALPTTAGETYNIYMTGGTIPVTRRVPARNLNWISYTPAILDFTNCMEDDGVTHAVKVQRVNTTQSFRYNFSNENISIICDYVGLKGWGYTAGTDASCIYITGIINTFNWKSIGNSNGNGFALRDLSDFRIIDCYDSPQATTVFGGSTIAIGSAKVKIDNLRLGFGRVISTNRRADLTIDNIIKVGTSNFTSSFQCNKLSVGNITLENCTFFPGSNTLNFYGSISANTAVQLQGTGYISGTVTSNRYLENQWILPDTTQIFENFTGRLRNFQQYSNNARVLFRSCNITVDDNLIIRTLNGNTDVVTFEGYNSITHVNTGSDLFRVDANATNRTIELQIKGAVTTNATSFGTYAKAIYPNGTFKEKLKEIVVRSKKDLVNRVLDSNMTYVLDGTIVLLTGEYIQVPATGLTLIGYGFDVSKLQKNVAGQSIFSSPTGNSGNFITKDIEINSGLGSVFNLIDSDGSHAIELNDVNFTNCTSLGTLNGYRQFTGTTCGIYGCSDGFTLSGTWNGFKLTNTNVSGFASTGTIIKNGTSTLFRNRVYLDLNLILPTGAKITDLTPSNFQKTKSFQLRNNNVVVNNVIDDSVTTALIPNISVNDPVSDWTSNVGIKNSGVSNMITNSASVTLPNNDRIVYITFTGTTSTFTLPSLASSQGIRYMVINRGSGDITVNSNAGANDIDESGIFMNTYTIPSETTLSFFNNTLKFVIFNS